MALQNYLKQYTPTFLHFHLQEAASLYLTHTIRTLGLSLIGIFIPIYIYDLPNKLVLIDQAILNNLVWILLYYAVRSLAAFSFLYFIGNYLYTKIHLKRSILLSTVLMTVQMIGFYSISDQLLTHGNLWSLLILGIAIIEGIELILYWTPHHILFLRKISHPGVTAKFSHELGLKAMLEQIAATTGPVLGGIMLSIAGFKALFLTVIIIILSASIPVLVSVTERTHHPHHPGEILRKYLWSKNTRHVTVALVGSVMDALVLAVFWPVVMYIGLQNFVKIGAISTISGFGALFTTFIVIKVCDRFGDRLVHSIGIFFNTLFYLLRIVTLTPAAIYTIDILDKFNSAFYTLPFLAKTYAHAKKFGNTGFFIYRQLVIHLAFFCCAILALLVILIAPNWQMVFLVAAVGSVLTFLINL
jgi:hypothetical protein